jgi:hypothetical protein
MSVSSGMPRIPLPDPEPAHRTGGIVTVSTTTVHAFRSVELRHACPAA